MSGPDRIHVTHLFPQLELGGPLKGVLALLKYLDTDRFDTSFVALSSPIHPGARELIEDLGCRFFQLDQRGMWDIRVLPALRRILRDLGTQVLHTTLPRPDWYGVLANMIVPGMKTVTTIRGVDDVAVRMVSGRGVERLFNAVNRRALARIDRVVPHSKGLVEYVRRMGVAERRIRYIPNGLDLAPFESIDREEARSQLREQFGWSRETVVVGFVGTMWPYKDHEGFIRVAKDMHARSPDMKFLAVGQGPRLEEMRMRVKDEGLEGVVVFPGFYEDIPGFHTGLDVHLFMSFSEGLPRAVLESMAAGTPIVATAVTGVVDVIEDKETGLLVKPSDVDAAAAAVRGLLDDRELAGRLVSNASNLVRGTYSATAMAKAYDGLYEELVGR